MNIITINQVQDLLNLKLEAIKRKDLPEYLKTISSSNENYINEETGWFNVMIGVTFKDLSLNVVSITKLGEGKVEAIIQMKHKCNDGIDIKYPLLVGIENGILKDWGLNFNIIEKERYIIKYLEGDARVNEIQNITEIVFNDIEKIFTQKIEKKIEIKIYSDQELLRQRTYPSINWLFYGWAEPGESIKLYSGLDNINNYNGLIQHELVHVITMSITNGNTEFWLNEGIAMYYGCARYPFKDDLIYSNFDKYNMDKTLDELRAFNYHNESDLNLIFEWYATCGMYVKYMVERYSHEKVLELFFEYGKYNKLEDSKKLERPHFTKMLCSTVLGDEEDDICKGYISWIEKTKKYLK